MPDIFSHCEISGDRFRVSEAEQDVLQRLGQSNPWVGDRLPLPRVKPCEFVRQVFSYGNLMYLFRRRSVLSQQSTIARYSERDKRRVVATEEFWSDEVDNGELGRDYDFSRPFFEQFEELLRDAIYPGLNRMNAENSEYVNGAQNAKNCYLCFSVVESQDCYYCLSQYSGNDNVDCAGTYQCQFCYSSRDIDNCYECQHCADCWSCRNCFGCTGCRSCEDCFGCFGLTQQRYCVFNEQYTKESYVQFLSELGLSRWSGRSTALERCERYATDNDYQANRIINSEGCSGSYISRCANVLESYHVLDSRDCGHVLICNKSRDCWKGWAYGAELCYASGALGAQNSAYSYNIYGGDALWYSYFLYQNCSHCFGSIGLKGKSYSILNKAYSREAYFELLPRIVKHMNSTGEWGRYPSPSYSPHPYSESFGPLYIEALSPSVLASRGYRTESPEELEVGKAGMKASLLPDQISEVDIESFAGKVVECMSSEKTFNLQRAELEFYKKFSIPLPRKHWRVRLDEQIHRREMMPDSLGVVEK